MHTANLQSIRWGVLIYMISYSYFHSCLCYFLQDDGDAVQTVLEGKQQLATLDSGLGTGSSQTEGLEVRV